MPTFGDMNGAVPAFLAKLWRLVDDPETNNLICWSKDGRSFIIQNQAQFARELLPLNYKHNNMASFIRQLNMYGFHKITSIDNGGLKFDRDEMEFSHPYFKRNCLYLLEHIKRKISNTKTVEEKSNVKQEAVSKVLQDVKAMRGRQDSLDSRFSVMKQENEALWREIASLRQKHAKQQQIVNKLIQFLITIVQPSRNMSGVKRHMQLMIHDRPESAKLRKTSETESESGGPVIHELSEELLEEVADTVGSLMEQNNSPYDKTTDAGNFENESTPPHIQERPQSSFSVGSQNYDYSNQSAEDLFSAAISGVGAMPANGTSNVTPQQSNTAQAAASPEQLIMYHVSEVPDAHPIEVPLSPYNDDNNVLTTPLVREEEARTRLLKEKNKQRRNKSPLIGESVPAPKVTRNTNIKYAKDKQTLPQPILVKTEPDMDPMMYLNPYPDNAFLNTDSNLISPNSQLSGEESRQSMDAVAMNAEQLTQVGGTQMASDDLYNATFISNDMPADLFEDASLLNDSVGGTSDVYKLNEQQQFGRTTVNSGKFASSVPATQAGNLLTDNNGASTSAAAAAAAAATTVLDDNVASTSKTIAAGKQIEQSGNGKGKNMNNLAVAKYTGTNNGAGGGGASNLDDHRLSTVGVVNDHLDTVQEELDTLKDLLRSENYSIDQSMLLGLLDKKPVAERLSNNNNNYNFNNYSMSKMPDVVAEAELLLKLFNDSELLDTYGLSFPSDDMSDKSKGSELMTYQPIYDLSDMINDNNKESEPNNANGNSNGSNIFDSPGSVRQLQTQSSVLNTPYHD